MRFALLLLLCACSSSTDSSDAGDASADASSDVCTVSIIVCAAGDPCPNFDAGD